MNQYNHAEAFCLMKFRADDGTDEEVIWNSRDGVTPFVITLKSGKTAHHVDWQNDLCVPDHKPKPGDRIFIDLTIEKANQYAEERIARWKAENAAEEWGVPLPSVGELISDYLRHPGAPDIMEVTE